MLDSPEARFAIDAVREASLLARRIQKEMVTPVLTKDDRSPVTVADFAVQALVARRLADAFPGAALVAEEQASTLRLAESAATLEQITRFVRTAISAATPENVCDWIDRGSEKAPATFWTLDPIDGTKGFLRREQYAVALALVRDGRVELGVLGCPELAGGSRSELGGPGSLVVAAKTQGTWTEPLSASSPPRRLKVSDRAKPSTARLLRSVEKAIPIPTRSASSLPTWASPPHRSAWIARPNTPFWPPAKATSCCGSYPRPAPTTAKKSGTRRPERS